MSTIIGADTANKLAGLQIDLLQKLRQGHITSDHLEWFIGLSRSKRDELVQRPKILSALSRAKKRAKDFSLKFAGRDLGIITVPHDYDHATWLKTSARDYPELFTEDSSAVKDWNYPNPTRILRPGDKFRVQVFCQIMRGGETTSLERMEFLRTQKAVFTGVQGLLLVWAQKGFLLPWGFSTTSFDEPDTLWKRDGEPSLPYIHFAGSGIAACIDLWPFSYRLSRTEAFLCFTEA